MPSHEQELEGYILQGMARAIWSHAFIQWATTVEPPPDFPPDSDWDDVTPPTPAGATTAAKDFARGIGELNRLGANPMAQMFLSTRRYAQPRRSATRSTEADQAFQFGEDVALACLGTLDVPELGQYKIPEMTATLDDDGRSLSWDEGWTWHPPIGAESNPARWAHSDVQSLLFDKARYSVSRAQRWAQDHGFKYGSVDEGRGDFIHLRQFAHRPGQPCATVDFGHQGIQAIVCATGNPSDETLWAVLVHGQRHWEPGATSQEALETARARHGRHARLDAGPNGEPIRTGDCAPARRTRAPAGKATRTPTPSLRAVPMSTLEVAQAVDEVVPTIQTGRGPDGRPVGRFGDRKVFVAAVWRRLKDDPRFADMARQADADRVAVPLEFKKRLIEANRNRLLVLERADLVGAMDPDEVADSEIEDRGATFHFVHDTKAAGY